MNGSHIINTSFRESQRMLVYVIALLSTLHYVFCDSTIEFIRDKIRIVQFTDLHMGESDKQDALSMRLMHDVLSNCMPDFVVFTGDQVAGYDVYSMERKMFLWQTALSVAAKFQVPFATIFGNHDDQPFHLDPFMWHHLSYYFLAIGFFACAWVFYYISRKQLIVYICVLMSFLSVFVLISLTSPSHYTRECFVEHEHKIYPSLSYTGVGPVDIHGTSNYRVVLKMPRSSIALYFIDSGGGMINEAIYPGQLKWLESLKSDMPALAFVHVPPVQFGSLFSHECSGPVPNEAASRSTGSEELVKILMGLDVRALFVGHDHGNSWCCYMDTMLLCYGRHSGFGGYDFDKHIRGARVIDVNASSGALLSTRVVLWDSRDGLMTEEKD